jgi:hypothetical protein
MLFVTREGIFFSLPTLCPVWLWGLFSHLFHWYRHLCPQVKHPEHEAEHCRLCSVRFKNTRNFISTPHMSYEPGWRSRYSDWLRAGRPRGWSSSPCRVKNFLFSTSSRPALGSAQPRIQWVPGALSPGLKRPVREADHSPPDSAKVKKMWIYTSTLPYAFMA